MNWSRPGSMERTELLSPANSSFKESRRRSAIATSMCAALRLPRLRWLGFLKVLRSISIRRSALRSAAVAVIRAKNGGDGWESNPPRTPQQRPATILKTAGLASASVHEGPLKFGRQRRQSALVSVRPQSSVGLAVFLAVMNHVSLNG